MLLLQGGTVVDGTGDSPRTADVLIADGRIAAVGRVEPPADARAIDCAGLTVAPGFIDIHSHSDLQAIESRPEKALQGVTTEVVGNCGFSAFPAAVERGPLHDFANGILCGTGDWGWPGAAEYFAAARGARMVRVESLVGHGTLRVAVAGLRLGALTESEMQAMEAALDEALAAGACGFSTGLMYSPGASAPFEELERLCRVTARRGKVYATHMRNYSFRLAEAVEEQIELARRTGCRLQISHLQAAGRAAWGMQQAALEKIERARAEGLDVAFDCYPYVYGSTVLTQLMPQSALEGGAAGLVARLTDAGARARLARETVAGMFHAWKDVIIAAVGSAGQPGACGKEPGTDRRGARGGTGGGHVRPAGGGARRGKHPGVQPERGQPAADSDAPAGLNCQRRVLRLGQAAPAAARHFSGTAGHLLPGEALAGAGGGGAQDHGGTRGALRVYGPGSDRARPARRYHGVRRGTDCQPRDV